jgi:hypothetical protein
VEHSAGEEALAELLAQPLQVSGVAALGRGGGLDLDRNDSPTGELGDQVDLVAAVLLAQRSGPILLALWTIKGLRFGPPSVSVLDQLQ